MKFDVMITHPALGALTMIVQAPTPADAIAAFIRQQMPPLRDPLCGKALLEHALVIRVYERPDPPLQNPS